MCYFGLPYKKLPITRIYKTDCSKGRATHASDTYTNISYERAMDSNSNNSMHDILCLLYYETQKTKNFSPTEHDLSFILAQYISMFSYIKNITNYNTDMRSMSLIGITVVSISISWY